MSVKANALIQQLPAGAHLTICAARLTDWLIADLNAGATDAPDFTESRARSLMRVMDVLDEPTYNSFMRLVENDNVRRLALYDLLSDTELAENGEVAALVATSGATNSNELPAIQWLTLSIAAYAWQRGYPLYQLDPSSPPSTASPAGQLVKRAAQLFRKQVQRTATERDKLLKQINAPINPEDNPLVDGDGVPSLDEMEPDGQHEAILPHYRPPVPVNYPEISTETLEVEPVANDALPQQPERQAAISISESDIANAPLAPHLEPEIRIDDVPPERMPPIAISRDQMAPSPPPSPLPRSGVIMPNPSRGATPPRPNMLDSLRNMLGSSEHMRSTKLKVTVQQHPDGPGVYGLQVRVTCQGIRSNVAGITDRDGEFLAELPVPAERGLTYDVEVTWPRDQGGDRERKSITLHADRTLFSLPFYLQHFKG